MTVRRPMSLCVGCGYLDGQLDRDGDNRAARAAYWLHRLRAHHLCTPSLVDERPPPRRRWWILPARPLRPLTFDEQAAAARAMGGGQPTAGDAAGVAYAEWRAHVAGLRIPRRRRSG